MTIAAMLAILMFPLTWLVSIRRALIGKARGTITAAAFGDTGDDTLRRRIRAFGNFTEYVPMSLIMLAMAESAGASATMVWILGGMLLAGRIIHAGGMLYSDSPVPRAVGMMLTYPSFLVPAGWLLLNIYG